MAHSRWGSAVVTRAAGSRSRGSAHVGLAAIGVFGVFGILALEGVAHALCEGPTGEIIWTYPDERTASVPPDAVLWAVTDGGGIVAVEVDGVALEALGTGPIEQHQFAPVAPLSPGEHELLVRSDPDLPAALRVPANERRLTFTVSSDTPVAGDVTIDSLRFYPAYDGEEKLDNPPVGRQEEDCSPQQVALTPVCNDSIISDGYVRIGYRAQGAPIAYLIGGDTLLPAGCAAFWYEGVEPTEPASFSVTPVLATGVGSAHSYAGTLEIRKPESAESNGCSLGGGAGSATSGAGVAAVGALLAALARIRRRRSAEVSE